MYEYTRVWVKSATYGAISTRLSTIKLEMKVKELFDRNITHIRVCHLYCKICNIVTRVSKDNSIVGLTQINTNPEYAYLMAILNELHDSSSAN